MSVAFLLPGAAGAVIFHSTSSLETGIECFLNSNNAIFLNKQQSLEPWVHYSQNDSHTPNAGAEMQYSCCRYRSEDDITGHTATLSAAVKLKCRSQQGNERETTYMCCFRNKILAFPIIIRLILLILYYNTLCRDPRSSHQRRD